jgi:integrase/recombinase XerD
MLEFYFSYRGVLNRLRSGALGAEMDRIAGDLHSQGYKPASANPAFSRSVVRGYRGGQLSGEPGSG